MKEKTNPLDHIRIASPCGADWEKMYGSERKRFCAECRLNVYNISEMTREEAENLIIRSEGRLCLKIFRRSDGTVLTQNCPVGRARVKRRLSRMRTAVFGIGGGFAAGVFGLGALRALGEFRDYREAPKPAYKSDNSVQFGLYGSVDDLPEVTTRVKEINPGEGVSFGGAVGGDDLANLQVEILTSRF